MQPDVIWHRHISFAKSFVRIGAGALLIYETVALPGIVFILAEILGILEELV